MTLTYTNIMSDGFIAGSDEFEEYGEDFEYEVDDEEITKALANILFRHCFRKVPNITSEQKVAMKKGIEKIINQVDLDELAENYEYDLKDYFRRQAFESRED